MINSFLVELFIGRWDLVFISTILFVAFLFLIPVRKKSGWKTHGVYTGFIIALFAEMFGFPLTIYFISSFFNFINFPNQFLEYMSFYGMPIGLVITFIGLLLVVTGWRKVYRNALNHEIALKGIYAYVRHPQYLGLIMITLGWLIHWPTIPTILMWPILVVMYYKLAKKEEKEMEKEFGEKYLQYKRNVPMIFPRIKI